MSQKAIIYLELELHQENRKATPSWIISSSNIPGLLHAGDTLPKALNGIDKSIGILDYLNQNKSVIAPYVLTHQEMENLKDTRRECVMARNRSRKFMTQKDDALIAELHDIAAMLEKAGDKESADIIERSRQALCSLGAIPLQWKKGMSALKKLRSKTEKTTAVKSTRKKTPVKKKARTKAARSR